MCIVCIGGRAAEFYFGINPTDTAGSIATNASTPSQLFRFANRNFVTKGLCNEKL